MKLLSRISGVILTCLFLALVPAAGKESDEGSAWLGIVVGDAGPEGLEIAAIVPAGPAYKADLRVGDLLQAIDGAEVSDWDSLQEVMGRLQVGTAVEVKFLRGSSRMSRSVTPRDRARRNLGYLPVPETGIRAGITVPEMVGGPDPEISLVPISPELREHYGAPADAGVLVVAVEKGSAAEGAGVQVGDVLVRGGGAVLRRPDDLRIQLLGVHPDGKLEVDAVRDGEPRKVLLPVPAAPRVLNSRELALEKEIRRLEDRVRELEEALRKQRED